MFRFLLSIVTAFALTGCGAQSTSVATIAPATPLSPTATSGTAPGEMFIGDYLKKALAQNNIRMLDIEWRMADKVLSVEIEPSEGSDPQGAAEFTMGVMVKATSLAPDASTRPQTLNVLYTNSSKELWQMSLTEPTLSDLIEGRISEDDAIKKIAAGKVV